MNDDLRVRPAAPEDATAMAVIYGAVVEQTAASFEWTPPDAEEFRRRMAASPRLPWLVATRQDTVVGYAYAAGHRARAGYRWSVECSAYIADGHRGRGVGRRLYEHLVPELRALGYVTLLAGITLPNEASVGLHEALGFRPIGVFHRVGFKHGAWHDVGWWELELARPQAHPADPREWGTPGSELP